jgi:diguanylate cyclase (GGDEF)-like protein
MVGYQTLEDYGLETFFANPGPDVTQLESEPADARVEAEKTAFFLKRLRMLAQTGRMFVGGKNLAESSQDLVEMVRTIMGVDAVIIRKQQGNHLTLLACAGVSPAQLNPVVRADEGIAAHLLKTLQPLSIENTEVHPTTAALHARGKVIPGKFVFSSYAGVALVHGGRSVGILGIYTLNRSAKYTTLDLEHLEVVSFIVAASLANQELIEDLQGANRSLREQITRREQVERQLTLGAFHDALTGLPTRAVFSQHLQHCLDRSRRDKLTFHVLHADLDRFKYVNDSLGHLRGDQVLLSVVTALKSVLRPGDIVARLAGDEFAVLLETTDSGGELLSIIGRLQQAVSRVHILEDELEVYASVSMGVVSFAERYHEADDMLRDAEIAMYQAKQQGKASVVTFRPEMHARVTRLFDVEKDLRKAIEQGEIRIELQPIRSNASWDLVGFEALARWTHPVFGNVPPSDFISVAEDAGLINDLGAVVLAKACEAAARWQTPCIEAGLVPPSISVNLSALELLHANYPSQIDHILRRSGLRPDLLCLELTESMLLQRPEEALERLKAIQSLGVRIVIDDFGTGYSSLSYLDVVPANALKIDKSFVSQMQPGSARREVVPAIISLAHALRMVVVAEGVETAYQRDCLREFHCDFVQGYFVGDSVTPEMAVEAAASGWATWPFTPSDYEI